MNRTALIRNRPLRRLARTLVGRERIGDSDGAAIDNAVLDSADGTPITDSADSNTIIIDEEA